MKCFICKGDHGTPNKLVSHLKVIHGICTGRTLYLKCGQVGCPRSFGSFSGFRKHLNKCHVNVSLECMEEGEVSPHKNVLDTSNATSVETVAES